jgi:hypothetical protein
MMLPPVLGFSQTLSRRTTVRRIAIHDGEKGPEVEITTSEPTLHQIRMLTGPDRVVIDFPGALPGEQLRSIAVNSGGMKRVRVSLFEATPPVTWVVLDLAAPGNYQLFPSGNTVIVSAGDTPEAVKTRKVPELSATDPVPLAPRVEGSSHDYSAPANRVKAFRLSLSALQRSPGRRSVGPPPERVASPGGQTPTRFGYRAEHDSLVPVSFPNCC